MICGAAGFGGMAAIKQLREQLGLTSKRALIREWRGGRRGVVLEQLLPERRVVDVPDMCLDLPDRCPDGVMRVSASRHVSARFRLGL